MGERLADIFISYARADQPTVARLAAGLEAEGYEVWWDQHIQSGSDFSKDIEQALDEAKAIIVCWSSSAINSRWVKDEANHGAEDNKLLAISLDGALPPIGFRQFHCTDFSAWRGKPTEPLFKTLKEAVNGAIAGRAPRSIPTRPKPRAMLSPAAFALAAILLIVTAGAVAYFANPALFGGTVGGSRTVINGPPSIAVAPIRASDESLSAMASNLSENISAGLTRFPLLTVKDGIDGEEAADYRLQGSLQRDGDTIRLSARLFESASGKQVWGRNFDRPVTNQSLMAIQDDLRAHVVAAVGDPYGAMLRDLHELVAAKDAATLTPFEAVLRHSIYRQRIHEDDHKVTRAALERAARLAPNDANVWASLAAIRIEEIKHDYNRRPDAGDKALEAARRAVQIDPNNSYAHLELAEVHFFLQNPGAFRAAAERSYELNPFDSDAVAMLGILSGYAGDWDRGREWTARAMSLNPDHPGWYRFNHFFDAYRDGRYEEALDIAQRINQPGYFADPYAQAIAMVRLGMLNEARKKAREFQDLWPGTLQDFRVRQLDTWMYAVPELGDMIIADLTAAGLEFSSAP